MAVLILAMGTAGGAFAYEATHGEGQARFHVADARSDVRLSVDTSGTLTPGDSIPVSFTVSNPGSWTVRVHRVHLDSPGFTDLPDGCPASAFGFDTVKFDQVLSPGEKQDGKGTIAMDRRAPIECAGAAPVVHLQVD